MKATVINRNGLRTEVVVVDLSPSGAKLELPFAAQIDREHRLFFERQIPEKHCELVWRDGYNAGVRFLRDGEEEDLRHPRHHAIEVHKTPLAELRAIAKRPR